MASMLEPQQRKRVRKRTVTESEKKRRRQRYAKEHPFLTIGKEHVRWRNLKAEVKCKSDEDLAKLLLDRWFVPSQEVSKGAKVQTQPQASSTPMEHLRHKKMTTASDSDTESKSSAISGIDYITDDESILTQMETRAKETQDSFIQISFGKKTDSSVTDPSYHPLSNNHSDDESDTDMEYEMSLSISQPDQTRLEGLPIAGADEMVFDFIQEDEDSESTQDDEKDEDEHMHAQIDVVESRKSVCYDQCLLQLAATKVPEACQRKKCNGRIDIQTRHVGCAVQLVWMCSKGHTVHKWNSQPCLKRIYMGNFLLSSAILCSGNNYKKIALLFKFMNMGIPASTTHYQIQRVFTAPIIDTFYNNIIQDNRRKHQGKELILAGDGRNDSPGHSAMYCTYTFLEYQSKDIIACEIIDKRMTQMKSTNMEKEGIQRALKSLLNDGMKVKEICTDAHPQISSLLKKDYQDIFHSYDTWHGAKNFGKKLMNVASETKNKELRPWVQDIINHFWYCSRNANGSEETLIARWRGILHHVTNVHSWALGDGSGPAQCEHVPLQEEKHDDVKWLEAGSHPHESLAKLITDTRLLHTLKYYINFRHTGELESFHEHILMYASKRFSYSYPMYKARNQLAVIDYQMHKDRQQDKDKKGVPKYHRLYSKRNATWSAVAVKEKKTYSYMSDLLKKMVDALHRHKGPIPRTFPLQEGDPRLIKRTIASTSPIPTSELVKLKKSRFEN